MVRPREELVHGPLLGHLAGVHDDDVVRDLGNDPEVVGDHDDRGLELLLQGPHQPEDLCLRRHVERRGRLVRDQQVGLVDQRHRDHHALAHAARELVRVVVDSPVRVRDPDRLQQLERTQLRVAVRHVPMQHHRLDELLPDRVHRIQRRHRVLEDHRDVVAAEGAQLARVHLQQVDAVEERLALGDRVAWVVQAHDRKARDALAAAGLADDPERLPLLDGEADAVDGLDDAVVRAEARPQVPDFEQRHQLRRIRGSMTA
jgi:hypothetical protein